MPKVSILIPSYNHEAYVADTLRSILCQSVSDFEIVIIDDCSTDRTADIIRSFNDPRIRFMVAQSNQGIGATINQCVQYCHGHYIIPFSSDDLFLPGRLEKQITFLEQNPQVGAVFGYANIINEHGDPLTDPTNPYQTIFLQPNRSRHEWLRFFFYSGNAICGAAGMFRASLLNEIGLFNERLHQLQDFDLWIRIVLRHAIHIMEEPLVGYRVRDGEANASGRRLDTIIRLQWEHRKVLENFLNISPVDLATSFPEVAKYVTRIDEKTVPYVVARLALDTQQPALRKFGLDLLYTLLDPTLGFDLPGKFGFRAKDLICETGSAVGSNIYNILVAQQQTGELQGILKQKEAEIECLRAKCETLKNK